MESIQLWELKKLSSRENPSHHVHVYTIHPFEIK